MCDRNVPYPHTIGVYDEHILYFSKILMAPPSDGNVNPIRLLSLYA